MKIGMPPGPYTGGLVDVEKRAAEEEERAEHEVREEDGRPLAAVPLRVEERAQRARGDPHDHHERGERAERVHVVGAGKAPRAACCIHRGDVLDDQHRDDEPDRREPRERRQDQAEHEERHRREHEAAREPRERDAPRRRAAAEDDRARVHERGAEQRAVERRREEEARLPGDVRRHEGEESRRHADHEAAGEVVAVEADALRDELADGAVLRRERGRPGLVRARIGRSRHAPEGIVAA
jgi:hypothetical protein